MKASKSEEISFAEIIQRAEHADPAKLSDTKHIALSLQTKKNTKRSVHAMTEIKYAERTSVQPAVRYSWESTQVLRPQRRR